MLQKVRFQNVDFLRFVFAVFIVMFHFNNTGQKLFSKLYMHGILHLSVCVDFFFIIAGFFLFNNINLNMKTLDFIKKRFFRLAPMLWISVFLSMICYYIIPDWNFSFDGNILRLFLLHDIGFAPVTGGSGVVISWFIPVLFWCSVFYFYISKTFEKKYLNLIIWLITICSLGLYLNANKFCNGGNNHVIYGFMDIGVLRGLFGIGIGYFISELWKDNFLKTFKNKWIFSAAELFLSGFLIYYLLFSKLLPGKSAFLFLFLFAILFYLFLIKKGILSNLLENKYLAGLGKYSYSIYVMHFLVQDIFDRTLFLQHKSYILAHFVYIYPLYVLSGVIFGILCYYIFEKPVNKFIKQHITV